MQPDNLQKNHVKAFLGCTLYDRYRQQPPPHGFTAPWAMIKFALNLPREKSVPAFVAVTHADTKFGNVFLPSMERTAIHLIALIILLKGYIIRGIIGVDMPSNWLALQREVQFEDILQQCRQ